MIGCTIYIPCWTDSSIGRANEINSEAKCLCNLAYAQTQLRDYSMAAESFAQALSKAKLCGNLALQCQASEGLGSLSYLTRQYSKANEYFTDSLDLLNQIGDDTGLARERIMEKLSDVAEAQHNPHVLEPVVEISHTPQIHPQVSMQHSRTPRYLHSKMRQFAYPPPPTPIPLLLPPIQPHSLERERLHGRSSALHRRHDPIPELQPSLYETDDGLRHSSTLTSLTSDSSSSQLSISVFSPARSRNQSADITEGSLALGPNAKQLYTVQVEDTLTKKGHHRKRLKSTKIVPIKPSASVQESSLPSTNTLTTAPPTDAPISHNSHSRMCNIQ